jgi:hypothetical protein
MTTAPVGDEGRFSVHGRGLKLEFGVNGGPRAAEAWVRSIQLSLLAYQHQAKRKFLKTSTPRASPCVRARVRACVAHIFGVPRNFNPQR